MSNYLFHFKAGEAIAKNLESTSVTKAILTKSRTFQIQYSNRAQPLEIVLTAFPLTSLDTLLICLLTLSTGMNVGRARGRYGIKAPAVTGHEMFERTYRIQMNTLENAVLLLPALWVNAGLVSDRGAAAFGALWLISRIWYAIAYQSDPAKRGPAYGLSMTAFAITWCTAAWGIARILMH